MYNTENEEDQMKFLQMKRVMYLSNKIPSFKNHGVSKKDHRN